MKGYRFYCQDKVTLLGRALGFIAWALLIAFILIGALIGTADGSILMGALLGMLGVIPFLLVQALAAIVEEKHDRKVQAARKQEEARQAEIQRAEAERIRLEQERAEIRRKQQEQERVAAERRQREQQAQLRYAQEHEQRLQRVRKGMKSMCRLLPNLNEIDMVFDFPLAGNVAYMTVTRSKKDNTQFDLRTRAHPKDSDLCMQHYFLTGTKEEIFGYFACEGNANELVRSIEQLSNRLNGDDENYLLGDPPQEAQLTEELRQQLRQQRIEVGRRGLEQALAEAMQYERQHAAEAHEKRLQRVRSGMQGLHKALPERNALDTCFDGLFPGHAAYLSVEPDKQNGAQFRLETSVKSVDADTREYSHILTGTKEEILAYIACEDNAEALVNSMEQLFNRLNGGDEASAPTQPTLWESESGSAVCNWEGVLEEFHVIVDYELSTTLQQRKTVFRNLIIPEAVVQIGDRGFEFSKLPTLHDLIVAEKLVFPKSLQVIGAHAFSGSIIMDMELPSSLKAFGPGPLMCCYIDKLRIPADMPRPNQLKKAGRQFKETIIHTLYVPSDYPYDELMPEAMINQVVFTDGPDAGVVHKAYAPYNEKTRQYAHPIGNVNLLYDPPDGFHIRKGYCYRTMTIPEHETQLGMNNAGVDCLWAYRNLFVIEKLSFPAALTAIGRGVFQHCFLMEVELPAALRFLGAETFQDCYIRTLRIPHDMIPQIVRSDDAEIEPQEGCLTCQGAQFQRTVIDTLYAPEGYPYQQLLGEASVCNVVFYTADRAAKEHDMLLTCIKREFGEGFLFTLCLPTGNEAQMRAYSAGTRTEVSEKFRGMRITLFSSEQYPHVVRITDDIPTFDSCDREFDSWHDLFLARDAKGLIHGMYCTGGYRVTQVVSLGYVLKYPEELKKYLEG